MKIQLPGNTKDHTGTKNVELPEEALQKTIREPSCDKSTPREYKRPYWYQKCGVARRVAPEDNQRAELLKFNAQGIQKTISIREPSCKKSTPREFKGSYCYLKCGVARRGAPEENQRAEL